MKHLGRSAPIRPVRHHQRPLRGFLTQLPSQSPSKSPSGKRLGLAPGQDASAPHSNSQVAKPPHFLDLPPMLPSRAELNEQDGLSQLVERARLMRRRADVASRKSQHHELTMCYHAALFVITHEGAWENLFRSKNRDATKPRSDLKVLQAVLLEYTGDDLDGRKKASRCKRALEGLFLSKTPSLEVYAKLQNEGGVDGLLQSRPGNLEQVARKTTLKSVTITDPGLYSVVLPPNTRQKLVLGTDGEGASYEVKVSKKIAIRRRAVVRRIKPANRL